MKYFAKKILIQMVLFIFFSFLYLLSFRLPLNSIFTVFTYKGIFLILLISLLFLLSLIFVCKKTLLIDKKDIAITIILFFFIHLLIFCMCAVTVERSFSVFLLSEISKSDSKTINLEEAKTLFYEHYIENNGAIEQRFNEQVVTGSINSSDNSNYVLTFKGDLIVKLFNLINMSYNINSPLL